MNKIKVYLLSAIGVTLVTMAATFFVLRSSGDAYADALPADATAIARLDVKSFMSAAKLGPEDLIKMLRRSLRTKSEDADKSIGINMKCPVYAFAAASGNFGGLAAVDDVDDLTAYLEEARAAGYATEIIRQRGYSWTVIANQWLLAFDDDRALLMGPAVGSAQDQLRTEMARLLEQDKSDSGRESVLFAELKKRDEPLTAIVSPELLPRQARAFLRKYQMASREDALLCVSLETDDNELELEADVLAMNDATKTELKRINELLRPIKGSLIDHAHAENVAWLAMNVQGSDLLDVLRSNATVRLVLLYLNLTFDLDRIIRAVDGDLTLELADASSLFLGKTDVSQLKGLYLTAKVANTDFLSDATAWGGKLMGVQALTQTDFVMNLGVTSFYFGVEDKTFYLGSHQGLSTEKNDYLHHERSDIKGARFFATIALPNVVQQLADKTPVPEALSHFERLNLEMKDAGEFKLTLTAPKGTNIARELLFKE